MSVGVRAALDVDLDALIQLNRVVQSLHAALYPGDFTPVVEPSAVRAFFAARLASPTSAIGIAQADRVPGLRLVQRAGATGNAVYSPSIPHLCAPHRGCAGSSSAWNCLCLDALC